MIWESRRKQGRKQSEKGGAVAAMFGPGGPVRLSPSYHDAAILTLHFLDEIPAALAQYLLVNEK
jgi:hypothetical protein